MFPFAIMFSSYGVYFPLIFSVLEVAKELDEFSGLKCDLNIYR